ncbi:MAG: hypothetical protein NZX77_20650 [Polyangiaceae bacterium]|nr:hypothetical protein [Polyangiaceae bacterium]
MNERVAQDTALVQSLLWVILFTSALLPWYQQRNAFHELGEHPVQAIVALLHFGVPLMGSTITFARRLQGRVPQRTSFWMLAVPEMLKAAAASLAILSYLYHTSFPMEQWIGLLGAAVLVGVQLVAIRRGSQREGWDRWAHLLAAMAPWHLLVGTMLFLEQGSRHLLPGPWLYLFTAAALLPLLPWTLWPRRTRETPAEG